MKRPRFSLRGLLIFTARLAAFCYWRDRPRQMANRFVALINAERYGEAQALFGEQVGISNKPSASRSGGLNGRGGLLGIG